MVVACRGRALQIFRQTLAISIWSLEPSNIQHDASKSGPRSLILGWVAGFPTKELLTNRVQAINGTGTVPAQLYVGSTCRPENDKCWLPNPVTGAVNNASEGEKPTVKRMFKS